MKHRFVLAVALALLGPGISRAQSYPARPLRMIISYAPGAASDIVSRTLATNAGESPGQPLVVEYRPGAGGAIAAAAVAHAAPDGYTLLFTTSAPLVSLAFMSSERLPYDPLKDFTPITPVVETLLALIGTARAAACPEVPTLAEALPGFTPAPGWLGVLGPAKLPAPVVSRLHESIVKAVSTPEVQAKFLAGGFAVTTSTPQEFLASLTTGIDTTAAIIKATGVKPE